MSATNQRDMRQRMADNLARCIQPLSIAVVGASARAGSFGRRTIDNLGAYSGRTYLVSATTAQIDGRACHASISALPEVPDCVILAVPRDACEAVVRECAQCGVGGVVIYASGFAETGSEANHALQRRIAEIAREAGMVVFGPNCLGVINYVNRAVMSFIGWPAPQPLAPHSIGLVSQSGSLGLALAQAAQRGVSFSHVLTYGNGAGVDAADLIAYLARDRTCAAIVCVFESAQAPRRLVEAAELARNCGKPLIVQKIASGAAGASAALSHTGSLAGSHADYRAVLRAAGAVWIEDFEALIETAAFFAKAPEPLSRGVAVIGGSGGGGIMAADKAELHGVALPQPSAVTEAILREHIPDFGAARNPCDVTAQVVSNPRSLAACCDALAADEAYGAIVSTQTVAAEEFIQRLGIYENAARGSGKPVCTVWMSEWHEGPGALQFEHSARVAVFHSIGRCFAALRAWYDRHAMLALADAALPEIEASHQAAARHAMQAAPSRVLTERASKGVLSLYGIPVARDLLVRSAREAREAGEQLGYPVVLKIESEDLPHKSEVGGVRLNLRDADELAGAYDEMMQRVALAAPRARLTGAVVSTMLRGHLEILIGGRVDTQFGPLVTVGFGGVLVELLKDTVTAPAPVNPAQASAMLEQLKAAPLLRGFRGQPAIDAVRLAQVVSRVSVLIADMRETVAELDINPVLCGPDGICAADALIVRAHGTPMPEAIPA